MIRFILIILFLATPVYAEEAYPVSKPAQPNAHQFEFISIDGRSIKMSDYRGKVVMVVNTASHCGFTEQYKALQSLYDEYKNKGFVVLGVPSADFGGQEFHNEKKVQSFTKEKYAINFPMAGISFVKGSNAHPFYKWAAKQGGFLSGPKWNFHKYIIGKKGEFVDGFGSTTSPISKKVKKVIEAELAKLDNISR